MKYYPDQRMITHLGIVHHDCRLPDEASGVVHVHSGQMVDTQDVIASGQLPARHILIDAADILGLRDPRRLPRLLLVQANRFVEVNTPIAGRYSDRGKRVFSPIRGRIVATNNGRIIMQEMPETVTVNAGISGQVGEVYPKQGASIKTIGAITQGVWGNGRRVVAGLRVPLAKDIRRIVHHALDIQYKGSVMVLAKPITPEIISRFEASNIRGIIAPSMPVSMIPQALDSNMTIMLTEGFGHFHMTPQILHVLQDHEGYHITLDTTESTYRRPEAIINRPSAQFHQKPHHIAPIRVGCHVRIIRQPYFGQIGHVCDIPHHPITLANGLRVMGARVELMDGETINVPLANLELAGR